MIPPRIPPVRRPFARAFTLIELLIVIAIIAVLAALSIGSFNMANKSAARNRTTATLQAIVQALERYKADNGEFPEVANPSTMMSSGGGYPVGPAQTLYQAITGDGNDQIKLATAGSTPSRGTVADPKFVINGDFIPAESSPGSGNWKSKLNSTMKNSDGFWLMDGFGHPFQYQKAAVPTTPGGTVTPVTVNPTYDLWSFGDVASGENPSTALTTRMDARTTAPWLKNW